MDHALQMISYIADIGDILVLMARRKRKGQDGDAAANSSSSSSSGPQKKCLMICHVFSSDDVSESIEGSQTSMTIILYKIGNLHLRSDLEPQQLFEVKKKKEIVSCSAFMIFIVATTSSFQSIPIFEPLAANSTNTKTDNLRHYVCLLPPAMLHLRSNVLFSAGQQFQLQLGLVSFPQTASEFS